MSSCIECTCDSSTLKSSGTSGGGQAPRADRVLSGMPKRASAGASAEAREAVAGGERWGAEQSHEELCHVAAQEGLLQRCATPDGEAAIGGKDWSVLAKTRFCTKNE